MHNNLVSTPAVAPKQPVNHLTHPRTLKLALDVHLLQHVVAMQYDGQAPKPAQRFKPQDFVVWVQKQLSQGWRIVSCYEAGPLGYVLHRQLTALGVTNYVIRPRNWDDQHQRVKTDRTDARAMLSALDRFVAGNPHALALVRVPTDEQERRRSESRIRQSLRRDLKMIVQRGRGLALQYGYRLSGKSVQQTYAKDGSYRVVVIPGGPSDTGTWSMDSNRLTMILPDQKQQTTVNILKLDDSVLVYEATNKIGKVVTTKWRRIK